MAHQTEREAKFLVSRGALDLTQAEGRTHIRQVYLLSGKGTVRVRAYEDGRHELTLKFSRKGDSASEYNLALGADEGPRLYAEAVAEGFPELAKVRYRMPATGEGMEGLHYELDLFEGRLEFLTLCELEYAGEARPPGLATRPPWYPEGPWGVDVSGHGGFRNSSLVQLGPEGLEELREEFAALLRGGSP